MFVFILQLCYTKSAGNPGVFFTLRLLGRRDAYDDIRFNGIAILCDSSVPIGISVRKRTKEKEITAPDQG